MLLKYDNLGKIALSVVHSAITASSPKNVNDFHTHSECEIYINLTGNVSFAVENKIYPITSGDILIIRPYEYHHCIYHDDSMHEHYWILLSVENKEAFNKFFNAKNTDNHHFRLAVEKREEFFAVCKALKDGEVEGIDKYGMLFDFLRLLQSAESANESENERTVELSKALNFIAENFTLPITVKEIASSAFVSVNTLERHFEKRLKIKPKEYLKKKRLAHSAFLLHEGKSVLDACTGSGFSDCSSFIALFKKYYGVTPRKYKLKML